MSPDKKSTSKLIIKNGTEYDYPLACRFTVPLFVKVSKPAFDLVAPAEGVTHSDVDFFVSDDAKIVGGKKVCEIEISDGIFDSKTLYEADIVMEMAYCCRTEKEELFSKSSDTSYTRGGVFFANCGETVVLQIPLMEKKEICINLLSGKIKDKDCVFTIQLDAGLNRVCFEMAEDGSFEFLCPDSGERLFCETVKPECFI